MLKLAGLILDPYDDPEFVSNPTVQELGLPSPDEVAGFKNRDFAVIIKTASGAHRRYPVKTAPLVKLSAAYFNEYGHALPENIRAGVRYHLKLAAARHGIELSGEVASPVSGYQPHEFVSVGEPVREDPGLSKEAAFKLAQDEFIARMGSMTPAERALAANDLSKVGEITDRRVQDYVPSSEYGPLFKEGMHQRKVLVQDNVMKKAAFEEIEKALHELDARRGAVILNNFDKLAGIMDRVPDAFRTCWGGFIKQAMPGYTDRQFGVGKLDEKLYRVATLARAHGAEVRRVFSDDIAMAFLRNPVDFYYKASGQVKKTLDTLANAVGQKNPKSEIHTDQIQDAKDHIRSGEYAAWSKTC